MSHPITSHDPENELPEDLEEVEEELSEDADKICSLCGGSREIEVNAQGDTTECLCVSQAKAELEGDSLSALNEENNVNNN
jgi:hypothetical protein